MSIINKIFALTKNDKSKGFSNISSGFLSLNSFADFNVFRSNYSLEQLIQGLPVNCINFISNNFATAKPLMFKRTELDDNAQLNRHEFIELLNNPNPFQSANEFKNLFIGNFLTYGNAYIYLVKTKKFGIPKELYIINPNQIQYKIDSNTNIPIGFINRITGYEYGLDEIFHFKNEDNIGNGLYGKSIIYQNEMVFSLYQSQLRYRERSLINDGAVKFLLRTNKSMNDQQKKKFIEEWKEYKSGVDNVSKTALLTDGIEVATTGVNAKELDYNEGVKITEQMVCKAFALSPDMLGDSSQVNRSTANQNTINFYKTTLEPLIHNFDSKLNLIIKKLYPKEDIYIRHVLPRIENEDSLKEFELGLEKGSISKNEYRKYLGYSPIAFKNDFIE